MIFIIIILRLLKDYLNIIYNLLKLKMELYQRILALPEEIHILILEWYKRLYLNKEITEKKAKLLKHLQINLKKEIKNDPINFIDLGDFTYFNHLMQNSDYENKHSFSYLAKSMVGVLEFYYSLSYHKRNEIKKNLLLDLNSKYYKMTNYMSDYHLPLFLENKDFENLIDPEDLHSGSTGFFCYTRVMVFMFGNYESKVDLWTKMANAHF